MYTNFVVSSITEDNALADKIDAHHVLALEQWLNQHLRLADYGTGVAGIAVVFLGTDPEVDVIHQEELRFEASTGEVYLQLRLPYTALEQATEAEVGRLMAQRYVQGLREAAALVPEFDWERLSKAVEDGMGRDEG